MKISTLLLANDIRWNIAPNDPQEVVLSCLGGFRFLNPLARAESNFVAEDQLMPFSANCCHVLSRRICLIHPNDSSRDVPAGVVTFLRTLRLVTKQAALCTDVLGVENRTVELIPSIKFPGAPNWEGSLLGRYRLETAATMASVQEADAHGLAPNIPVFHEILLDALRACEQDHHREANSLRGDSRGSVEALARTMLQSTYDGILASNSPPQHVNVLTMAIGGGRVERKDPIDKLLSETDNFSRLLHEIPLYLTRRSLLQENQTLYQNAMILYRTRNRLSHGQAFDAPEQNVLSLDREGAFAGLRTAL